jgi:signal transduction histidine kinase
MTTLLTPHQLEALHGHCPRTETAPQALDSSMFQALTASGLHHVATTTCAPGEVICREGEPGTALYLIRAGHAAVVKGSFDAPVVLACRGAGEFVGEMALLENLPRSASIVALDEVQLLAITHEDFQRMLSGDIRLDIGMLRELSGHLRATDDAVASVTHAHRTLSSQVSLLEAANQQLLELQRLRQQTSDLIVHDLRNPLHGIIGAVGMLQMVLPENTLQENRALFAVINNNCDRMQRLVNSLLDISRMEVGETELSLEMANLPQLIQAAVLHVSPTLQEHGIASNVFMPANLPSIEIDVDLIDRVMTNLLDNAIKFTPGGGQISVAAEWHADHVAVSINDTGCGIPPEQRAYIFDRFARGTISSDRRPGGFGLGLTFCRLAIEAHGGHIWVEDGENGVGCKCIFTLPLTRNEHLTSSA